jgi:hypothetical protein
MSNAPAPAPEKKPAKKGGTGAGDIVQLKGIRIVNWFVLFVVGGSLLLVSHYAVIFFLLGMSPALVAGIADRRIGNCASRTIGAFNFMGILPFIFELMKAGDRAEKAQQIATDPSIWMFVYSSAILGWAMIWMVPQITAAIFTVRAEIRVGRLKRSQDQLVEEWGISVSEGTKDHTYYRMKEAEQEAALES